MPDTEPAVNNRMLSFERQGVRLKVRVGAIILDAHARVLLVRSQEGFWFIPGGRVEFMESSRESIRREMEEELGCTPQSERLLWVIEDFYTYNGISQHEFGFYYLTSFPPQSALYNSGDSLPLFEEDQEFHAQWHDLSALSGVDLRPSCLIDLLRDIPDSSRHVVFREGEVL
jgi:8-oxo-dGTP pyrophosphatase MutT (NUDIX family)